MPITLNHLVLPSHDNAAAARRFAEVLGLQVGGNEGVDGKFTTVPVDAALTIFFMTTDTVVPTHLAFATDAATFDGILARLRQAGIAYGNDPRDPANCRTDHPLVECGCFWVDADGHLIEVTVGPARR